MYTGRMTPNDAHDAIYGRLSGPLVPTPPALDDKAALVRVANPNGAPVIPPAAVPYVLAGAGVLTIVGEELSDPAPWSAARVIGLVTKLVGYLALGASPGLRRRS